MEQALLEVLTAPGSAVATGALRWVVTGDGTSGGLLLGVPPETDTEAVVETLRGKDLAAAAIGRATAGDAGHIHLRAGLG